MPRYILPLLLIACLAQYSFAYDDEIKNVPMQQTHLIDDRPPPKKLLLFPAPEPRIAFEHHLLPQEHELQEGNAVPFYDVAILNHKQHSSKASPLYNDLWDDFDAEMPISEYPAAKAKEALSHSYTTLRYLRYGSVRRNAQWAVPFNDEREKRFGILLEEAQEMRMMSYILGTEARLAVYENRPVDALNSVRTGYAMARHLSRGHFLVEGLIANSIIGNMNHELWYAVQQPDCPNLYWSITELPRPMLDYRASYENEFHFLHDVSPDLRRVGREKLSKEEYEAIYQLTISSICRVAKDRLSPTKDLTIWAEKNSKLFLLLRQGDYNAALSILGVTAKEKLLAAGFDKVKVEAMSMAEAFLVQMVDTHEAFTSEISKSTFLSTDEINRFSQNYPDDRLQQLKELEVLPISSAVYPALKSMRNSFIKREREFTALRTFEAIRMHVHKTGKLPSELAEIKVVPVPNDPATGKPLEYQFLNERESGKESVKSTTKVMLSSMGVGKNPNPYDHLRYEITLVTDREAAMKQLAADKKAFAEKLATMAPKPKEEPIMEKQPGPEDNGLVVAKGQEYYEAAPKDDKELVVRFAKKRQSMENMKQIGLAMATYADAKKTYPPAYIADKDGKPLLSWRVMILPYVGEEKLYKQFKLDEPWDSEQNRKLIAKMPKVYKNPLAKPLEEGKTCYLVPFGKETVFTGAKGTQIREVRDGLSKTVALVEAAPESAVEWTKPSDWNFDSTAKEPFKGLFGLRESGVLVGTADGAVNTIGLTFTRWTIKSMMTKANADVYEWK